MTLYKEDKTDVAPKIGTIRGEGFGVISRSIDDTLNQSMKAESLTYFSKYPCSYYN